MSTVDLRDINNVTMCVLQRSDKRIRYYYLNSKIDKKVCFVLNTMTK